MSELSDTLSKNPHMSINQACETWADTKAAYRFFSNEAVTAAKILAPHQDRTLQRTSGLSTILVIQDTCYFKYDHHPKTEGLGIIAQGKGYAKASHGLVMHTSFCISSLGVPLGILDQSIWAREPVRTHSFRNSTLPIEKKESFRWLKSLRKVKLKCGTSATQVVTICDREADIYEFFAESSLKAMPVLVRAAHDRAINKKNRRDKPTHRLWAFLKDQNSAGTLTISVPEKRGEPAREAILEIRFAPIVLNPPPSRSVPKDSRLNNIDAFAIYVSEKKCPADTTPLEWMLITSLPVRSYDEAIEKVKWYSYRWRIENFHKILKSGLQVEHCRLQYGDRLERYLTLQSILAWRLHWLTLVGRTEPDLPCTTALTENEWRVIYQRRNKGKPFPSTPPTLQTVIRWIAQMGGFLGRKGDGEPGIITIWRGWQRLVDLTMGWELASLSKFLETYG